MKTFIKKCFIVFIFATSFMFLVGNLIHIGDNEYTYIDYQILYDLDYPQTQLNNHSLREVFENGLLNNDTYTSTSIDFTNFWIRFRTPSSAPYTINVNDYYNTTGVYTRKITNNTNTEISIRFELPITILSNKTHTQDTYTIATVDIEQKTINVKIVGLSDLGISHLTVEQMNYWYSIYNTLKGLE